MSIYLIIGASLILLICIVAFLMSKSASVKQDTTQINNLGEVRNKAQRISMSYEEALEASKQFIYDIIKAVMQKFSPPDIQTLLKSGEVLANSGVKYMHMVDVESLKYQKYVQARQPQPGKSTSRS
jgi:nitrate/nitrite-specific signal transduction histidine kinase